MLAVAAAASLLTSVVFGLFPAFHASRTDVRVMLVESGGSTIAGATRRWPGRFLVVGEVALGIVLVVGAGLLIRTFSYLTRLPAGVDPTHVITATVSLQDARYETANRVNDLFRSSLDRIRGLPGVEQAAVALLLPYERGLNQAWRFDGEAQNRQEPISITYVTPEYFSTLRIPLLRGRVFTDRDTLGAPPVLVVSDAFARRYSPDANPIGRRLIGTMGTQPAEIVGVVGDIQQQVSFGNYGPIAAIPTAYVASAQWTDGAFKLAHTWFEPIWIGRTAGPSPTIASYMQQALRDVDPQLPFNKFRTIDDVRGEAVTAARLQAGLLSGLAAIALLLCALGVFGLVAHSVEERRREFGVRMALGATAAETVRVAAWPGLACAAVGVLVGLGLASVATSVLRGLVWGVTTNDRMTFTLAAGVVLVVATLASLIPSLRATRVDPISILRAP